MRHAFLAAGGVLSVLCAFCLPSYDFSSPDGGGPDATTHDGAADTGGDVPATPDASDGGPSPGDAAKGPEAGPLAVPGAVFDAGAIASETGNAQQRHLVFALGDARYWFFTIDSDTHSLKTLASPDLATWTPGATLALPSSNFGEGRNFSVAYAQVGGVDVIHVALALNDGTDRAAYHARAVVSGGALTWDPVPAALGSVNDGGDSYCDPDGPSVAITQDRHVMQSTSWIGDCDDYVYVSNDVDQGTSWTPGFTEGFIAFLPWASHTRQVTALQGGDALHAWDDGWTPQAPTNVRWNETMNGAWPGAGGGDDVFPDAGDTPVMAFDDWSMCRRTALESDLVRRESGDGGTGFALFQHYRLAANASAWTPAEALADDPGAPGTGVVMMTDGTSLLLFAIATDYAIHYARWNAGAWSPWAIAVPAPATSTRGFLSGTGCEDTAHAVLSWTEGDQTYEVMMLDVRGLF